MRNHRAEKTHRHKLKRAKRQRIKRHMTFVETHGTAAQRREKNLAKYPSLAEPDQRPSIRVPGWEPKPEPVEEPKETATETKTD